MSNKTKWKNDICQTTGKAILSHSKAQRLKNRYDDINRYYYCEDCDGYHLTKMKNAIL